MRKKKRARCPLCGAFIKFMQIMVCYRCGTDNIVCSRRH